MENTSTSNSEYCSVVQEARQNLEALHRQQVQGWAETAPFRYRYEQSHGSHTDSKQDFDTSEQTDAFSQDDEDFGFGDDEQAAKKHSTSKRLQDTIEPDSESEEEEEELPDDTKVLKEMVQELKETNERIMGQNLALLKDVQDMQTTITDLRAEKAVMADKIQASK
eukprot:gb/GECG01007753.1/.p1 GENE.gb/GECG01007753.1/~~gb/GECG01007753.1/.p1  ORF type:complete len:166 (+),score=37.22 gb/GECG01007753.1/:1-498(+)